MIGAILVSAYVPFGATVIANHDHHGVDVRYRSVRIRILNRIKTIGILLRDFGATVIANHHGVDARQRTVQALSCQICSQYSQTITACTRDRERYRPSRARFAVSIRRPSRRGRETQNGNGPLVPDLQSVFANHHGVDARHKTVYESES